MKPILDWSSYKEAGTGDAYADIPKTGDDFARAVAVCINSRQCENSKAGNHSKGVMCPSFRVLEQHEFSTGGRIQLLKSALNGKLGEKAFADDILQQAMALCVGCKGCKRECENEVDMAMIKVEYLAQLYAQKLQSPSLRTRLMANIPRLLGQFPLVKPLLKLRTANGLLAKAGERLLAISAKRNIPASAPKSYLEQIKQTPLPITQQDIEVTKEVVLFIDSFNNHFSPQIIDSAILVLKHAGYKVLLAQADTNDQHSNRPLCCGRTHIAHGLVEQARKEARRTLAALLPHVIAGRKIIGLEPACLLAIRDDYRFLGLGEAADKVAKQAILFEEFIAKEVAAKRFKIDFKALDNSSSPLLVHGHCHQKAVGAMKSMRKVLKLIPELKFEFIDSSCCGMAGSFGLEAEHSEIAMAMANQSLFPAIEQQPEALLIANGFSCRHQIKEGSDRNSLHLAQILHQALP